MSARDLIQEALHSLEANKGRSLLTILGIVIGIASVIAMTSLIGGIQNSLVNSLGLNAARMVQIYSSQELTESDIEKLQKLVPQIEQIGIVDSAYTEYKTGDKSYTVMAQGVDSDMLDAVGASKLVAGRTYSQAESQSGSRVALISRNGADQLYGNEQDALGKTIKVSQRRGADCRRYRRRQRLHGLAHAVYATRNHLRPIWRRESFIPQRDGTCRRGHGHG